MVVAAAGNAGPGPMTMSAPALGRGVISVGASVSGLSFPVAQQVSPRTGDIQAFRAPYSANPPSQPVTGELVDVGQGKPADYDRVGDVTGKVVAFRASIPPALEYVSPALIDQAKEAEDRGAIAALGYTSSGGPVLHGGETGAGGTDAAASLRSGDSFRMDRLVVLGLHDLQWEALRADLSAGPVRVQISGTDATDEMPGFSSRGPAPDFGVEPDLVAPGVEIRSTWPLAQWAPGVYRISGTSMASPHVAGAAALLTQLDPGAGGQAIAGRLTGSATILDDADPSAQGARPPRRGGGRRGHADREPDLGRPRAGRPRRIPGPGDRRGHDPQRCRRAGPARSRGAAGTVLGGRGDHSGPHPHRAAARADSRCSSAPAHRGPGRTPTSPGGWSRTPRAAGSRCRFPTCWRFDPCSFAPPQIPATVAPRRSSTPRRSCPRRRSWWSRGHRVSGGGCRRLSTTAPGIARRSTRTRPAPTGSPSQPRPPAGSSWSDAAPGRWSTRAGPAGSRWVRTARVAGCRCPSTRPRPRCPSRPRSGRG